jgi:hypothetical protein
MTSPRRYGPPFQNLDYLPQKLSLIGIILYFLKISLHDLRAAPGKSAASAGSDM